jgi:FkbM family methyltransferase
MSSVLPLFEEAVSLRMDLPNKSVLIYGAGNSGKMVANYLMANDIEVLAFIDQRYSSDKILLGKPIYSLSEALELFGQLTPLLISIHNRAVDMVAVTQIIGAAGFKEIFNLYHYVSQFPEDSTFRYFLANPSTLKNEYKDAQTFLSALSDEKSKKIFVDFLKFRLTGNYSFCPHPELDYQYAPQDIPAWKNPMRLIDCGAYDGDSISLMRQYGYVLEEVIALEPDYKNYKLLCEITKEIAGVYLPCGVSSESCTMQFHCGDGEASRAMKDGGHLIQMISIDEAFPSWGPTLIKMDIEGGEFPALMGASKTIAKYRPGLALSAYHLPTDLWRLGLLIASMDLGYQFYLRSHGYSSFDTVLYAIPQ